jgi:hypothetical protein
MSSRLDPQEPKPVHERPELIDHAIRLMTPDMSEGHGSKPQAMTGADAAREIARVHGISDRQARTYVGRARDLIAAEFAADLPTRAANLATMQASVFWDAREDRDWSGCNGAVRNLCTIYGIDSKTVTVKGGGVDALLEAIKTSPGARDAEIAALEAKEREDADRGSDAG